MTKWATFPAWLSDYGIEPAVAFTVFAVTAVLAFGWMIHFCTLRAHPLWQVLTWRFTLVSVIAVGLATWPGKSTKSKLSEPDESAASTVGTKVGASIQLAAFEALGQFATVSQAAEGETSSGSKDSTFSDFTGDTVVVSDEQPVWNAASPFDLETWTSNAFLGTWIWLVWFLGMVAVGAKSLWSHRRMRMVIDRARPVAVELFLDTRDIARSLGYRRVVDIRKTAELPTPMLLGTLKPVLLLPEDIDDKRNFDKLRPIFVHEFCHLRANDHIWGFLARLVSVVLWPHPLVWKIWAAHSVACEGACNRTAAKVLGDSTLFARSVANLQTPALQSTHRSSATNGMHEPAPSSRLRSSRRLVSSPLVCCKGPQSHRASKSLL